MSQSDSFRFDVRVRERMTRRGLLSEAELEKHLGGLGDQEGRYEALALAQPALLRASEPPPSAEVRPAVRREPLEAAPAPRPVEVAPAAPAPVAAPEAAPAFTPSPVEPRSFDADADDDDDDDDDLDDEPEAQVSADASQTEAEPAAPGPESLPPETGELDNAWEKDSE